MNSLNFKLSNNDFLSDKGGGGGGGRVSAGLLNNARQRLGVTIFFVL